MLGLTNKCKSVMLKKPEIEPSKDGNKSFTCLSPLTSVDLQGYNSTYDYSGSIAE